MMPRLTCLPPLALAAGTLAALAGCSFNRPPSVEVTGARVGEVTGEGVSLEFTLAAANANDEGLPLKRIDYALSIDGREVFRGARSPEATLRRNGDAVLRVPAVIRLADGQAAPTGERPYTLTGWLTYTESGKIAEILFESEVSQPSVSFSGSGSVDFSPAPAAK